MFDVQDTEEEVTHLDVRNESFVGGNSEIDELLPTTVSICAGR